MKEIVKKVKIQNIGGKERKGNFLNNSKKNNQILSNVKNMIHLIPIVLAFMISFLCLMTPNVKENEKYDKEQAFSYLQYIAKEPHATGSLHQEDIAVFLTSILTTNQLKPRVLNLMPAMAEDNNIKVSNIYIDLALGDGSSVLFVAHYDSLTDVPGACDNGMSIASLMEAMIRFPKEGEYKTNIKVLLTDGKEMGLLGSTEFLDKLKFLLEDVVAVIHVEGVGNGPVMLIESNNMMNLYQYSITEPIAYSAVNLIAKIRMKNELDTKPFLNAGFPCLTISTITGYLNYHKPTDTLKNAKLSTQAHNLSVVYELMEKLSYMEKEEINRYIGKEDGIYFTLFQKIVLSYSNLDGFVFAVIALSFIGLYYYNLKRKPELDKTKLGFAIGGVFLYPILCYILTFSLFSIFSWFLRKKEDNVKILGSIPIFVLISAVLITIFIVISYLYFRKLNKIAGETLVSIVILMSLGMVSILLAVLIPGLSYVFYFPVIVISICKQNTNKINVVFSHFLTGIIIGPIIILSFAALSTHPLSIALLSAYVLMVVVCMNPGIDRKFDMKARVKRIISIDHF